jgi:hypothetical protein
MILRLEIDTPELAEAFGIKANDPAFAMKELKEWLQMGAEGKLGNVTAKEFSQFCGNCLRTIEGLPLNEIPWPLVP